jgi:glycerol uptake facilitator-like aquaporin
MTKRQRTYFSIFAMLINIAHIHIIIALGSHRAHPCAPSSNPANDLGKKMLSSFYPMHGQTNVSTVKFMYLSGVTPERVGTRI